MRQSLNKTNVIIESLEPAPSIIMIKKKKFIKAKVIQVGSAVETIKPGDIVMSFNEGTEIALEGKKARIVGEQAIVVKIS